MSKNNKSNKPILSMNDQQPAEAQEEAVTQEAEAPKEEAQRPAVPAPRNKRRRTYEDSEQRLKLSLPGGMDTENFQYRWVDGTGARISEMESRGYQSVDGDTSIVDEYSGVQRRTGMNDKGDVKLGVLMRIPKKYYDEDRAMMRKQAARPMEELRKTKGRTTKETQSDHFKSALEFSEG